MFYKNIALILAFGLVFSSYAENIDELVLQIAKLRTDIEKIHNEIEETKMQIKNEIKIYQSQKADLQVQINREELKLKELKNELKKLKKELAEKSKKNKNIIPDIKKGIALLKDYINQSLPFRKKERLQQLTKLEEKIDNKLILPEKALNTLWAYYEDELRLTRENGIYKDTITIEGQTYLVNVAKQGMIGIFFKTPDNKYGVVRKVSNEYQISFINDEEKIKQIEDLFDAYKKQIRTGYFKLPNFLPKEVK